jgi:hypothetical protein
MYAGMDREKVIELKAKREGKHVNLKHYIKSYNKVEKIILKNHKNFKEI